MKNEYIIKVENLRKLFPVNEGFLKSLIFKDKQFVHAVDGINFVIRKGEILTLVGESGCGKTTTARMVSLLDKPTEGTVFFKDQDIYTLKGADLKAYRKKVQMIFQDPYQSLNPRRDVYTTLAEPLYIHKIGSSEEERYDMVSDMLEKVELIPAEEYMSRYPHELSGGQRQRVVLAKAMILNPEVLIADEPVSMLDVSVRAGILNLMMKLQAEFGTLFLFITHDLSVARYISTNIGIMYLGKLVEMGPTEEIIKNKKHPYTQLLISAVPVLDPNYKRKRIQTHGDIPDAINIPKGCRFHTRCNQAMDICRETEPELREIKPNYFVACHLQLKDAI